jgi:hypothetical protein
MFWLYKVIIRGLHVKEGITDPGNPYDIVPKHGLLDQMVKENVRNFWIYRISLFSKKKILPNLVVRCNEVPKQGIPVFMKST